MKKLSLLCVIVTNEKNEILLIKRGRQPFKGYWALISGIGESKKGIEPEIGIIEEVNCDLRTNSFKGDRIFSMALADDEHASQVIVFLGKVNESEIKMHPPYSLDFKWISANEAVNLKLAFEHNKIIDKYLKKIKIN